MASPDALREAATWLAAVRADVRLRSACAAMASRMRDVKARNIGLLPADDGGAVPPVAVLLARALAERSTSAVAVVDAHGAWRPAAPAEGSGAPRVSDAWVSENVAVLSAAPGPAPAAMRALRTVCQAQTRFAHLVVDLTGFDRDGEVLEAGELVDAVVLVARRGRTSARTVARWHDELCSVLSSVRFLGVVLAG